MSSSTLGEPISSVEIANVGQHGIWLQVAAGEYFLPYDTYPWFKKATIEQILEVQFLHGHHLYWPQLDVDLSLEILQQPAAFPLVANASTL